MDDITTFRIGSNGKGSAKFYYGCLDDFTVWARALDSTEIITLNNKIFSDYPKEGLLFAFDFNDMIKFPESPGYQ